MKKVKKVLAVVSILASMLVMQVAPAFANADGTGLWCTKASTVMKESNSAGSTTVMNMEQWEALAHISASTGGYEFFWGCRAGHGLTAGFVADTTTKQCYTAYYNPNVSGGLNLYTSESQGTIYGNVADSSFNTDNSWQETHSGMALLQVHSYKNYINNDPIVYLPYPMYVHTNFVQGYKVNYYVWLG